MIINDVHKWCMLWLNFGPIIQIYANLYIADTVLRQTNHLGPAGFIVDVRRFQDFNCVSCASFGNEYPWYYKQWQWNDEMLRMISAASAI